MSNHIPFLFLKSGNISRKFVTKKMRSCDKNFGQLHLDSEHSCILDKEDWTAVDHYEYAKSLFIYMNQAPFLDAVYTYREKCGTICK